MIKENLHRCAGGDPNVFPPKPPKLSALERQFAHLADLSFSWLQQKNRSNDRTKHGRCLSLTHRYAHSSKFMAFSQSPPPPVRISHSFARDSTATFKGYLPVSATSFAKQLILFGIAIP